MIYLLIAVIAALILYNVLQWTEFNKFKDETNRTIEKLNDVLVNHHYKLNGNGINKTDEVCNCKKL